jgi:hypothetical protein
LFAFVIFVVHCAPPISLPRHAQAGAVSVQAVDPCSRIQLSEPERGIATDTAPTPIFSTNTQRNVAAEAELAVPAPATDFKYFSRSELHRQNIKTNIPDSKIA